MHGLGFRYCAIASRCQNGIQQPYLKYQYLEEISIPSLCTSYGQYDDLEFLEVDVRRVF